jgi:hypothetical protein
MRKNLDLSKPLTIEVIGTDDDPCFGKHHDSLALECQRCGDAEFCLIAQMHNMNVKRLKIETTTKFKDLEEEGIKAAKKVDPDLFAKYVRKKIRRNEQGISVAKLIRGLSKKYDLPSKEANAVVNLVLAKSKKIHKTDGKLYYRP